MIFCGAVLYLCGSKQSFRNRAVQNILLMPD